MLKQIRKSKNITQAQLAKRLGVSRSAVAMWESGASEPSNEMLMNISKTLGVTVDYLLGQDDNSSNASKTRIPVYGNVAAGIPIEAITDIEDYEDIDEVMAAKGEYIALRLHGDSMEPRMKDGDVVVVRLQPDIDSGDIAIVVINGNDATCKKIKKIPEGILLLSINPAYEPMLYTKKQIAELPIRILGKVVELRAKF